MLADLVGSIAHPPRDDRGVRFAVVPRNQLGVGNFSATLAATWASWNYNHTSEWIADTFRSSYAREKSGFKALTVASDVGLSASELAGIGMSREEARAEGGVAP